MIWYIIHIYLPYTQKQSGNDKRYERSSIGYIHENATLVKGWYCGEKEMILLDFLFEWKLNGKLGKYFEYQFQFGKIIWRILSYFTVQSISYNYTITCMCKNWVCLCVYYFWHGLHFFLHFSRSFSLSLLRMLFHPVIRSFISQYWWLLNFHNNFIKFYYKTHIWYVTIEIFFK